MQALSDHDAPLISITAMSGIFPVPAEGSLALDAPKPVPLERWDLGQAGGARFGAFIDNADQFDAAAFSISRYVHQRIPTDETRNPLW